MVFQATFLTLSFILLPSLLLCLFLPRLRKHFYLSFPIVCATQFGIWGIGGALLYPQMSYGWGGVGKVIALATVVSLPLVVFPFPTTSIKRPYLFLFLLFLLSSLLLSDNAWIYSRTGFSLESGKTYFRPPLHDDMERHTLVTNALIRHVGSPLLAKGKFLYQLSWHHLSALVTSLLPERFSSYPAVAGVSLATGILCTFIVLWALCWLFPMKVRSRVSWFLVLVLFTHTDIYHFFVSAVFGGKWGIEADWSYATPSFVRYWSWKLILLSAPQHAAFFLLTTAYFISRRITTNIGWGIFFLLPVFVYSPLMTGFLFLPYWMVQGIWMLWKRRGDSFKEIAVGITSVGLGWIGHWKIFGFTPLELTSRPGTSAINYITRSGLEWAQLPILPFATMGLLGLFFLFGCWTQPRRFFRQPFVWTAILGWLLTYYLVTDTEIRRHFSMIGVFLGTWVVAEFFDPKWVLKRTGVFTVLIALVAHSYYLYSYLGKPSVVDPYIPWKDYFLMNEVLKTKYPEIPVVGAVDPKGIGNDYPVAMEVTTSFSMPNHAVIHTQVSPEKFRILRQIMASGDVANFALSLGYQLILWGPVEKQIWGERVRRRFIEGAKLLAQTGEVSLYELRDGLRERLNPEADLASSAFYLKAAQAFAEERWFQEALGYYFRAVELDPKNRDAILGLSNVLELYDRKEEARLYRLTLKD